MEVLVYIDTKAKDLRPVIYNIIEKAWSCKLYLKYKDYFILKKGNLSYGRIIVFDAISDNITEAIKSIESETGYKFYVHTGGDKK